MTPREIEEYRALRETIRERGTTRVWVVLVGTTVWAAMATATAVYLPRAVATLAPLLILATTFEIVVALHVGVERIGRYIQVFFEGQDAGWESRAMSFGRTFPQLGPDALFSLQFLLATSFNLIVSAVAEPVAVEWAVVGTFHVLFAVRVLHAKRTTGRQRGLDLERFQQLKRQEESPFQRN